MTAQYNPGREPCPVACQGDFRVVEFWRAQERYYAIMDNRCEEMLCDALLHQNVSDPAYAPWIWTTLQEAEQICSGLNGGEWWLCEICCIPIPIPPWLLDVMDGTAEPPPELLQEGESAEMLTPAGLICDGCAAALEEARVTTSQHAWDTPPRGVRLRKQRPPHKTPKPTQTSLFEGVS